MQNPSKRVITLQSKAREWISQQCPLHLPGGAQQGLHKKWYPFFTWGWEGVVSRYKYFLASYLKTRDILEGEG